jgi:hypothetical protein
MGRHSAVPVSIKEGWTVRCCCRLTGALARWCFLSSSPASRYRPARPSILRA